MNKIVAIFFLLGMLSGCGEIEKSSLVGVWVNYGEKGEVIGYDQYKENGKTHSWGTIPYTGEEFEAEGNYTIEGNKCCITIEKSSIPMLLPVGDRWCDEVLSVDDKVLVYRTPKGEVAKAYRQ
ncbi:hypothetical protein [Microbulbifer marinus]|uniref:hypothetical protein n=1 Tax=Microbulbifer marinus TaxID=658218 RepID=UPI0011151DE4|nr:hypothetical protein [Microbulbifer marinus]